MYRYQEYIEQNLDVRFRGENEFYALCPFHADSSPSFGINVESGLWVCHGCKERGNIKKLALHLRTRVPNGDATLEGVEKSLNTLTSNETEDIKVKPESWLLQFGKTDWWHKERGFSQEIIDEFQLGWDYSHRAGTIPIRDIHGRLLGVIRRFQSGDFKYLYPKGFKKSWHLFGAWKLEGQKRVAIVEGSLDVVACWDADVPAVGILGSKLHRHQISILRRLGVQELVMMTDNDKDGRRAIDHAQRDVTNMIISVGDYMPSEQGMDPNSLDTMRRAQMFTQAKCIAIN